MIKDKLRKILSALTKKDPTLIEIFYPKATFGDYSTNFALVLAKVLKKDPFKVASKIVEKFPKTAYLEKISVVKPGFINFYLQPKWVGEQILQILKEQEKYGTSDMGSDLKVLVEFISANPTGPLTLGNGRGGFFGDVLANVFKSQGYKVKREYYINDVGNQIEILGQSILAAKKTKVPQEGLYKGKYIKALASKISGKTAKEVGEKAAQIILEDYIKPTISQMGISFDQYFSESSLFKLGTIEHVLGILKREGLLYQKAGATWLKTTKLTSDKDDVLIRSDGQFTYFASDIAYHWNKIKRDYLILIDIWGADHAGHKPRLEKVFQVLKEKLSWPGNLSILINQMVRLVSAGQEVKMSKRTGTYITLDELFSKVGLDAARFFFLNYNLSSHMDFDLDLALERSEKNPVFYIQYAHVRALSILKKAEKLGLLKQIAASTAVGSKFHLDLKDNVELSLARKLTQFPEILEDITCDFQVQKLPQFCQDLADLFHNFYEKCQVLPPKKSKIDSTSLSRLALVQATLQVFKNALSLLGISAPERM